MRGKGKWIAGTILLLAVVVGRYLYQRDQNARYPLDFDLNQVETVTLSNIAATLTLTEKRRSRRMASFPQRASGL